MLLKTEVNVWGKTKNLEAVTNESPVIGSAVNPVLISKTLTVNFPAVGSWDVRILTQWTELNLKKERKKKSFTSMKWKAADLIAVDRFYRVVLVWIKVSRGQCVTVGFIQAERRGGWDLRKSPATVCGEIDGGLPGTTVVSGLLQNKLTGTRTLWRGGGQFDTQ